MSKISGQLLISGQFQDICDISGISGQLGALNFSVLPVMINQTINDRVAHSKI